MGDRLPLLRPGPQAGLSPVLAAGQGESPLPTLLVPHDTRSPGNNGVIDRPEVLVYAAAGLTSVQKKLGQPCTCPAAIVVDDVDNPQVVPHSSVHLLHRHSEAAVATEVQHHAIGICQFQRIGERLPTAKMSPSGKEEPLRGSIARMKENAQSRVDPPSMVNIAFLSAR